ncbi:MAG TPA: iron chelate uptake ABC transporter family permease subunit [Candidatus Babeliales bacterium]|nr:iron chelate uptake ABC transporter family permease subunit [Candidatus Babeliales bacterium]
MIEQCISFVTDYTFQLVLLGTVLLGALSGAIGVFAVLRKQSLLGDAISHAAFPGIALAFLLTWSKNPLILLAGGACAGLLGAACVTIITHYSSLKHDTALGIVLSVFFGSGLVLLTHVQKLAVSNQSVLNKYLFGNAATLLPEDVVLIACMAIVFCFVLLLFWKELSLIAFDAAYAHTLGYRVVVWDMFLSFLLVLVIVIGLQAVGVVLMSSLLIAPAAAARQWTHNLKKMIVIASFFGALSSSIGAIVSSMVDQLPTGPVIVVVVSVLVLVSLLFAPAQGLVWHVKRRAG